MVELKQAATALFVKGDNKLLVGHDDGSLSLYEIDG